MVKMAVHSNILQGEGQTYWNRSLSKMCDSLRSGKVETKEKKDTEKVLVI